MKERAFLAGWGQPGAADDRALGQEDAPVTLEVYGGYCCARTGEAWPVVEELVAESGGRLRVVWRHFPGGPPPTDPGGPWTAAKAAEAAASQGLFWPMHRALFEARGVVLGAPAVRYAAAKAGLDRRCFEAELSAGLHTARVIADFESGLARGVRETPAFFVDGVRHDETFVLGVLLKVADREEAEAKRRPEDAA